MSKYIKGLTKTGIKGTQNMNLSEGDIIPRWAQDEPTAQVKRIHCGISHPIHKKLVCQLEQHHKNSIHKGQIQSVSQDGKNWFDQNVRWIDL